MENINLIRKVAWSFYTKSNMEFNELFQEAALAYYEAVENFDPDNGTKLTSYAATCMHNHLGNICTYTNYYVNPKNGKTVSKSKCDNIQLDEELLHLYPSNQTEDWDFWSFVEDWPKECIEICAMVIEEPEKYLGETPNFKRNGTTPRQRIKHELRRRGWGISRINWAFKKMKTVI